MTSTSAICAPSRFSGGRAYVTTQDGKGSPIVEMPVHMAHHPRVRQVSSYAAIREAILGYKRLNGRTQFAGERFH